MRIRPGSAFQEVVAAKAENAVGVGIAVNDIRRRIGAGDVLDAGQGIAGRVPARGRAVLQIDGDSRGRAGVIGRIRAGAAAQRVAACSASQRIVSGPARQDVGVAIAGERVGKA